MTHEYEPTPAEGDEISSPPEPEGSAERTTEVEPPPTANEEIDFREKYLRELAEKENMRKRLLREQGEMVRLASEKSAIDLLGPIDQFEQALTFAQSMSSEIRNWAMGFEMICGQFRDWLGQQGIQSFRSEGEMFTPHLHEAIERIVDNDRPAGLIVREFTKGYRGRLRVLRPAKVAVCAHEVPAASDGEDVTTTQEVENLETPPSPPDN